MLRDPRPADARFLQRSNRAINLEARGSREKQNHGGQQGGELDRRLSTEAIKKRSRASLRVLPETAAKEAIDILPCVVVFSIII